MTKKEISCNKCGKRFDVWDEHENFNISKHLGYGTKYDGDDLQLYLCCDCMEELIDGCLLSPIIESLYT